MVGTWYITSAYNCDNTLNNCHLTRTRSIESTEKVLFFKDQNEKCLRFITFLSTNRLNKAMIGRKRRVKRQFHPLNFQSESCFYFFSALEVSRPYHAKSFGKFDTTSFQEIILSSGVFRRETASGFYPWGNVEGPRERVAEGLCGWRNGNSFPMTQSAQSHRQMRSIPRCPKAVFYVFCFWFHSRFGNNA